MSVREEAPHHFYQGEGDVPKQYDNETPKKVEAKVLEGLPFKRVMNGHLIIQIDEFRYKGKLVIPETAKRKPTKGRIVAVADDVNDMHVGDIVLYSQFAGYLLSFEGMPLMRTLGREEVLAILNEDSPEPLIPEGA